MRRITLLDCLALFPALCAVNRFRTNACHAFPVETVPTTNYEVLNSHVQAMINGCAKTLCLNVTGLPVSPMRPRALDSITYLITKVVPAFDGLSQSYSRHDRYKDFKKTKSKL